MKKQYATSESFRTALEAKLRHYSTDQGIELQRLRKEAAFDRFLCCMGEVEMGGGGEIGIEFMESGI